MAGRLHYLTVQDVLWINLQVTRKVHRYNYATLEEATFYQYAYGDSEEVVKQAQRLLNGFAKKSPIDGGNEATAFVAALTFLRLNGYRLNLTDQDAVQRFGKGGGNLHEVVSQSDGDDHETIREAVTAVLRQFPRTVESLGGEPVDIVADGAIH